VVRAVDHGLITEAEAQETWDLSGEELAEWREAVVRHGVARSGDGAPALPRSRLAGEKIGKVFSYFAVRWIQSFAIVLIE
jgi:hypothetical protein